MTACSPPWTTAPPGFQFNRPIAGFQLTQAKLADMALEYGKGVLLALHLGRLKDGQGVTAAQVSSKLSNARAALEIARTCRGILGSSITPGVPL